MQNKNYVFELVDWILYWKKLFTIDHKQTKENYLNNFLGHHVHHTWDELKRTTNRFANIHVTTVLYGYFALLILLLLWWSTGR